MEFWHNRYSVTKHFDNFRCRMILVPMKRPVADHWLKTSKSSLLIVHPLVWIVAGPFAYLSSKTWISNSRPENTGNCFWEQICFRSLYFLFSGPRVGVRMALSLYSSAEAASFDAAASVAKASRTPSHHGWTFARPNLRTSAFFKKVPRMGTSYREPYRDLLQELL